MYLILSQNCLSLSGFKVLCLLEYMLPRQFPSHTSNPASARENAANQPGLYTQVEHFVTLHLSVTDYTVLCFNSPRTRLNVLVITEERNIYDRLRLCHSLQHSVEKKKQIERTIYAQLFIEALFVIFLENNYLHVSLSYLLLIEDGYYKSPYRTNRDCYRIKEL